MRPVSIGHIDESYAITLQNKWHEISMCRAELYQADKVNKKLNTPQSQDDYDKKKEKYKKLCTRIYSAASKPLKKRLGNYCCYCERMYPTNLAVEHKCPKDLKINWNLALSWDNFLLSCTTCNSKKSTLKLEKNNIHTFLFPDKNDTYHIFNYINRKDYIPCINKNFVQDPNDFIRANNTLLMVKLNQKENVTDEATRSFRRWQVDEQAKDWGEVVNSLGINRKLESLITRNIQDSGCWSVWMNELEDIPVIKEILLYALPNTAIEYFIDNYWEHEHFFKEQHTPQECYDKLLAVIQSRIDYINGHINKLSSFQKAGIVEWAMNFTREVTNKIKFTTGQIIEINKVIEALKAI